MAHRAIRMGLGGIISLIQDGVAKLLYNGVSQVKASLKNVILRPLLQPAMAGLARSCARPARDVSSLPRW